MKSRKKIAFIFAFPIRTTPILITMPFGLNVIQLLDRKGYQIDVYLSEYRSDVYAEVFSDNVRVHFLDHNYLFPKEGKWSYYALTGYFRYLCLFRLRNTYSHIFASGMAGITLGGMLKRANRKSSFVYMNDEFPDQGKRDIWVNSEIHFAQKADFVSTPDEFRFPPLCSQIPGLDQKPHYPLPNTPLLEARARTEEIDWHTYFEIPSGKKLFLMAGGLSDSLLIADLMQSVALWPEEAVLIIKGKHNVRGFRETVEHMNIPGRIIWSEESFSPEKLHSLIASCSASICLYDGSNDNLSTVGKSSGKLMRSILFGRPVITSRQESFQFTEDLGIGVMADGQEEIAEAVSYILSHESEMQENCRTHYPSISFETYWEKFEAALFSH